MSLKAYEDARARAARPRDAEHRAFAMATRALLDEAGELKSRAEAVHRNRSLWETLAADCARDDNALPMETRASIISLARFVSAQSKKAMRDAEEIAPLIDINKMMMAGLSGRAPASE